MYSNSPELLRNLQREAMPGDYRRQGYKDWKGHTKHLCNRDRSTGN